MNIFVAKLNFDTNESDLKDAFQAFGAVDSVKIIMDKFSGRSKGFGFVELDSSDGGNSAIDSLNQKEFKGRKLIVNEARPKN